MVNIVVDFLLENLKEILSCSKHFLLEGKDAIKSLYEDLKSVSTLLKDAHVIATELQDMVAHFHQTACTVLDVMDPSVFVAISKKKESQAMCALPHSLSLTRKTKGHVLRVFDPSHSKLLVNFKEEVNYIKKALMDIDTKKLDAPGLCSQPPYASGFQMNRPNVYDEDIVVGFDHDLETIKEILVGWQNNLRIISIVGMGGIGKTTLAKRLYDDSLITYHFDVRGWTCVSQSYRKKDLLLAILQSVVENEDELNSLSERQLGENLYRCLKGQRYLIVLDDVWDVRAWADLTKSLPNDNNGSRVMLTTRLENVALEIGKPEVPPHYMSFLSQEDSWNLLQKKAFNNGGQCPLELVKHGQQIAAKCHGLPLALVVVGGLLSGIERKEELWKEVHESLASCITVDGVEQKLMAILGLSYDHLPDHLKSCFVYFGAFPEDYDIFVWRLAFLWIAEGFVVETRERSSMCIAEEYLQDLVARSLVIVTKRSSRKGLKTCRLHDMLRVLCLEKAKEMKFKFIEEIDLYQPSAFQTTPPGLLGQPLCFHSHGFHAVTGNPCLPHVRSTFSFATLHPNTTTLYIYKLLRVLNLSGVYLTTFQKEILELFHLRFLELHVKHVDRLPSQISNLWNLEVLLINKDEWGRVHMPRSFWNLVKLRHLRISDGIEFEQPGDSHGHPLVLDSLWSISALPLVQSSMDTRPFLKRIPNVRKLAFYRGPHERKRALLPHLANLTQLDTLKLIDNSLGQPHLVIPQPSSFPQNLKKITLSGGHAEWKELSKIGKLPNLEVLKLRRSSFAGQLWETSDGAFPRLKYLKLSFMDLEQWICSTSNHFPSLEHLLVERCQTLREIPSCLGDIATLCMIEVSWSSHSASESALKIQKDQYNNGNGGLKVLVANPIGQDDDSGMLRSFSEDERFRILTSFCPAH